MMENVPVRCPACEKEHAYSPPRYPCPCGVPVSLSILTDAAPVPIEHRTWSDSWVRVCCTDCGRQQDWPSPELGCSCGALLRLPVTNCTPPGEKDTDLADPAEQVASASDPTSPMRRLPADAERPRPAHGRPAFRPVTIRTARDAVVAASRYVRWLGFRDVKAAETRPASGVDLRGPEVVARVDPTTTPTSLRAVETLWLNGLNESATGICFSLAGYTPEARSRADSLALPLFVLDLTGAPQPVNEAAEQLLNDGPA